MGKDKLHVLYHRVILFFPSGEILELSSYTRFSVLTENLPNEDYETVMFDPLSGDMYVIQKNHIAADANVYRSRH